ASVALREHMKVRFSILATSSGFDRARKLFGLFAGFSWIKDPLATICAHRESNSSCDPLHQCTWVGVHSSACRSTHRWSLELTFGYSMENTFWNTVTSCPGLDRVLPSH